MVGQVALSIIPGLQSKKWALRVILFEVVMEPFKPCITKLVNHASPDSGDVSGCASEMGHE